MYTAYIGKRLIELVNLREGKTRTAQEFFDEVYVPLFFGGDRFLHWVNNAPFDQAYKKSTPGKPQEKGQTKKPKNVIPITQKVIDIALEELHKKVENEPPDGTFFLGGASAKPESRTSGQVTNISLPISEHDVYASWIGDALGIGVSGELNISLDIDDVLLTIYDGWLKYREYMNQTPMLKPHQVNTWNGYWLTSAFDDRFDPKYPFANGLPSVKMDAKTGKANLETTSWVTVILALSRKFPQKKIISYIYALSYKSNTTVGFIALDLPKVNSLRDLYNSLIIEQNVLKTDALEALYDTELGFRRACEMGQIGIPSLEPAHLREYIFSNKGKGKSFKIPKTAKETNTYILYQTWLIAMLDNKKLLQVAQTAAIVLLDFANQKERGTTTNRRLVENLFESAHLREFIERLEDLIKKNPSQVIVLEELFRTIALLPASNFPMFKAFLKINYTIAQAKQLQ